MLTAQLTKHASTENARIHVQDYVESMQSVRLETMCLSAYASEATLVIHSLNVIDHQVSFSF